MSGPAVLESPSGLAGRRIREFEVPFVADAAFFRPFAFRFRVSLPSRGWGSSSGARVLGPGGV